MADRVAIIGGGNLGAAIARGLAASGKISADKITITRQSIHLLDGLKQEGFRVEQRYAQRESSWLQSARAS